MKKLSDYQGAEAIELWADLMEPIVRILQDARFVKFAKTKDKTSKLLLVSEILREHKEDMTEIFTRIDPDEQVNGLTVALRTTQLLAEIGNSEVIDSFFELEKPGTKA